MLLIIVITTIAAVFILCIGFFEIKIPFITIPFKDTHKKIPRHTKKMLRKRLWYNEFHKGFVKLPTG